MPFYELVMFMLRFDTTGMVVPAKRREATETLLRDHNANTYRTGRK